MPVENNGGNNGEGYASAESVAGLARELDELRRGLYALDGLSERVDDIASAVADLADVVTGLVNNPGPTKPAPVPAPSWLVAPTDPELMALSECPRRY